LKFNVDKTELLETILILIIKTFIHKINDSWCLHILYSYFELFAPNYSHWVIFLFAGKFIYSSDLSFH